VPTSTILEIKVANIPESLIPELENKSCHASTMFNSDPVAVTWFRENLVMPMDWTLEHPHDIPPNASNEFEEQLPSFRKLGYKAWNIENRQHATSYIKVSSRADNSFIHIAGRADYLITREGVTVADYLSKIVCAIEIQSKHSDRNIEHCELQMQVYLLILMNTKHLPAVVGFLVLDNGQCRAFKSTRDASGGCLFEMNDLFHVGYIAQVMDNVVKSLDLN
jgi:hypothetical protein